MVLVMFYNLVSTFRNCLTGMWKQFHILVCASFWRFWGQSVPCLYELLQTVHVSWRMAPCSIFKALDDH